MSTPAGDGLMSGPKESSSRRSLRGNAQGMGVLGVGLAAVAATSSLAIGTVHETTRLIVFVGCAALLAVAIVDRQRRGKHMPLVAPHLALALAVGLTALQLIPLPESWLAALSPSTHELVVAAGTKAARPLTLDIPATLRELAKLSAYLAFFSAAVVYASRAHRRLQILGAVCALGVLVALLGFVQALIDPTRILFLYRPEESWGALVRGTFVNPNHFGALMTVATPCALAVATLAPGVRWAAAFAALVMNVAVVLCLGRYSLATTLFSQVLVLIFLVRGGVLARRQTWVWLIAGVGLVLAGVLAAERLKNTWMATSVDEFRSPTSKLGVWRQSWPLLERFPLTGVGRGAFSFAVNLVGQTSGESRMGSAENFYLQVLFDWGIPAGGVLLLMLAWSLGKGLKGASSDPVRAACAAGLAGLVVHEAFDFSIELPGVALPALACLACMHASRDPQLKDRLGRVRARPWLLMAPALCILVAGIAAASPDAIHSGRALAALARDPSVTPERLIQTAEAMRGWHPADDYIPYVVAARLSSEGHPAAIRWINRAAALNPSNPQPHLLAARLLARMGRRSQSLLEYRTAVAVASDGRTIWPEVVARFPDLEAIRATLPESAKHHRLIIKWLAASGRREWALEVVGELLAREPRDPWALRAMVGLTLDAGDARRAQMYADRLTAVDPSDDAWRMATRARIRAGQLSAAEALLATSSRRDSEDADLDLELARSLIKAGSLERARLRLDGLTRWELTPTVASRLHAVRAELERQAGNRHQAEWELERSRSLARP